MQLKMKILYFVCCNYLLIIMFNHFLSIGGPLSYKRVCKINVIKNSKFLFCYNYSLCSITFFQLRHFCCLISYHWLWQSLLKIMIRYDMILHLMQMSVIHLMIFWSWRKLVHVLHITRTAFLISSSNIWPAQILQRDSCYMAHKNVIRLIENICKQACQANMYNIR